ncbi:Uncharacterised protein [Raoultella terrigena]|uniref:Uncharacterized protein n=1 Tax=Raoultella terrigena TaxID=577 RepID=A0A4U9CXT4_RAOTE|nr:Uncharacterised protein [Raoultella terrigena]
MHVVYAVMVIVVTFSTCSVIVAVVVIVVIRAFHEQRFHAVKLGDRHLFCLAQCFALTYP